mmetsp:Transcript_42402/g.76979  ORF Transcript_42402/g.76979 Transcript_42402/m.76979 type:complete len:327 (+) Transcript_42402:33-1013(+)
MPELPEVEAARRMLEKHCVGRTVIKVESREQGGGPRNGKFDGTVIAERVTPQRLQNSLHGRKVKAARRRGKQLWLEFSGDGPSLLMHLGMTGALVVEGAEKPTYKRFAVDEAWPPRFTKLLLEFSGRKCVAFVDPRRFGRILLRSDVLGTKPISTLAPDPVQELPSLEVFVEKMAASSMPVKGLLLNQEALVSGVGNWVADEVLFHAAIHPSTQASHLSHSQVKSLRQAVLKVCQRACAVGADSTRFPKNWLFHYRWDKPRSNEGGEPKAPKKVPSVVMADGRQVIFQTVAGRTTAIVPSAQGGKPLKRPRAAETPRPRKRPAVKR